MKGMHVSDENATEQGITQQMGPDPTTHERRMRQARLTGLHMLLGGYNIGGHKPVRTTLDTLTLEAVATELADVTAERNKAQTGWDEAAEQYKQLQTETTAEVRKLRDAAHSNSQAYQRDVQGIRERMRELDRKLLAARAHAVELDNALGQRLTELLEARREIQSLHNQLAATHPAPKPKPGLMGAFGPMPLPGPHQAAGWVSGAGATGPRPQSDLPPHIRQRFDEMTGGRPWQLTRPLREVAPGVYEFGKLVEDPGCNDPNMLNAVQLAEQWDTTPELVAEFLASIDWAHTCEHHGPQVQPHEAPELVLRYREWRAANTPGKPMAAPFGTSASSDPVPVGTIISAAELVARGEAMGIQLVELEGTPIQQWHPFMLVVRAIPAELFTTGLHWDPSEAEALDDMKRYAQVGAKFRRVA